MVTRKPSVLIYCDGADGDCLNEVLCGIEEEGVPYEVQERRGGLDELAHSAARESVLGSGIGMTEDGLAMQMAALPLGRNVFELARPSFAQCRALGANAARAVKRRPFVELTEEESR